MSKKVFIGNLPFHARKAISPTRLHSTDLLNPCGSVDNARGYLAKFRRVTTQPAVSVRHSEARNTRGRGHPHKGRPRSCGISVQRIADARSSGFCRTRRQVTWKQLIREINPNVLWEQASCPVQSGALEALMFERVLF